MLRLRSDLHLLILKPVTLVLEASLTFFLNPTALLSPFLLTSHPNATFSLWPVNPQLYFFCTKFHLFCSHRSFSILPATFIDAHWLVFLSLCCFTCREISCHVRILFRCLRPPDRFLFSPCTHTHTDAVLFPSHIVASEGGKFPREFPVKLWWIQSTGALANSSQYLVLF